MPYPEYLHLGRQICATECIKQSGCVVTEALVISDSPSLFQPWPKPGTELKAMGIAGLGTVVAQISRSRATCVMTQRSNQSLEHEPICMLHLS